MIRLALMRHGHTAWNREGRIQGRSDIPLDPEARADFAKLHLPSPWNAVPVFASPLGRAMETAKLVSEREPKAVAALTEMDWGNWEGARAADLHADPAQDHRHVEDWGWSYAPPGGESPAQVRARLLPWLDARREDCVAVSHIGIMRVFLAMATGWNFDGPAPFRIKRRVLYVVGYEDGRLTMEGSVVRLESRA